MKYVKCLTFAYSFEFSKDIMFFLNLHVVSLLNCVMVDIILERIVEQSFSEPSEELKVLSFDLRGGEIEDVKMILSSLWLWSFSKSFTLVIFQEAVSEK